MKEISIFLFQDGIVLEELDLGLRKERNTTFQHQTGSNYFGDEGCAHLVEGLKKNKSLKKLNLSGISFKQHFFVYHFSACEITSEGVKSISIFLSQDGIVLEELNLGLKEKEEIFHFNSK